MGKVCLKCQLRWYIMNDAAKAHTRLAAAYCQSSRKDCCCIGNAISVAKRDAHLCDLKALCCFHHFSMKLYAQGTIVFAAELDVHQRFAGSTKAKSCIAKRLDNGFFGCPQAASCPSSTTCAILLENVFLFSFCEIAFQKACSKLAHRLSINAHRLPCPTGFLH